MRKVNTSETASIINSPYRRSLSLFGGKGVIQPDGEDYTLDQAYDLLTDDRVIFVLNRFFSEVTSRPWAIAPASDSERDIEIADFVKTQLDNLRQVEDANEMVLPGNDGFNSVCRGLLFAYVLGMSVAEVLWKRPGFQVELKDIKLKDTRRFRISYEDENYWLRLLTNNSNIDGIPLDCCKFIVNRFWAIPADNPYGMGMARFLIYPVEWRRQIMTYWLAWVDRYIDPTKIGTYDENAAAETIADFQNALFSLGKDMSIIMPKGFEVRFEQTGSNVPGAFKELLDTCDAMISLVLTGETTTGEDQKGPATREQVSQSIKVRLAKDISDSLNETLNCTLIRWIVDYNYSVKAYPTLTRQFEEPEDLDSLINRLLGLAQLGFEPELDWVTKTFGIPLVKTEAKQTAPIPQQMSERHRPISLTERYKQ